jgi:hypothetical protein
MLRTAKVAATMATRVAAMTRARFSAEKRMIRLSTLLASDGSKCGAQLRF